MDASLELDSARAVTPWAGKGSAVELVAVATLAASGAYTRSTIVDLTGARFLTLYVDFDAAAIANVLSMVPMFSAQLASPAAGDDEWFSPGVWDGTVTAGTLTASSVPSGGDYTISPDFGRILYRSLDIRTEPADATTDEIRVCFTLNVAPHRWFHLLYAEAGVVGTPGALRIKYALGA